MTHEFAAPIQGCVFDVDGWTGRLRVDRHEGPEGFEDMVVERDGTQTLAKWTRGGPLHVRLFRRDADGMHEIDELRSDWLERSFYGSFDLVPTPHGPALVAMTHWWTGMGWGWGEFLLRAWQPLDTTADPLALSLRADTLLDPLGRGGH